jgi:hypothetical protein
MTRFNNKRTQCLSHAEGGTNTVFETGKAEEYRRRGRPVGRSRMEYDYDDRFNANS